MISRATLSEKIIGISVIIVIIAAVIYSNFFVMKDGDYYVNLFPLNSDSKNYKVPGFVVSNDYGFHLQEVYWPNGGTLKFDDHSDYTDLKVNKKVLAEDNEGRKWYVVLTREKAK